MSFTDDENKRIEDEESKAQAEIREKFKSMFSKEELAESEREFKQTLSAEESKAKQTPAASAPEARTSGRVVKKVDVAADVPASSDKVRIKGPGYSLSGHKILTDSNYDGEFQKKEKGRSKKETPAPKKKPAPAAERIKPSSNIPPKRRPETSRTSMENTKSIPGMYYAAPGIQAFRQDVIPKAVNELTKRAVINNTRKVTSRARRVERAGEKGTAETAKGAQVSVFSPEFRTEYITDFGTRDSIYDDPVVASGKVNPNTARISRETINRMLEESEKEGGSKKRKGSPIISEADRNRTVSHRRPAAQKRRQPQLKSVDNSKKKQKQRLRQNKPKGPGGAIAAIVIILLVIVLSVAGYREAKTIFDDSAMDPDNLSKIEYTVTEGTTDEAVGEFLVSNGMVESTFLYRVRAKIFDAEYEPGTYELSPSYSTEKIINILSGFDYSSGS